MPLNLKDDLEILSAPSSKLNLEDDLGIFDVSKLTDDLGILGEGQKRPPMPRGFDIGAPPIDQSKVTREPKELINDIIELSAWPVETIKAGLVLPTGKVKSTLSPLAEPEIPEGEEFTLEEIEKVKKARWADILRGTFEEIRKRAPGRELEPSFEAIQAHFPSIKPEEVTPEIKNIVTELDMSGTERYLRELSPELAAIPLDVLGPDPRNWVIWGTIERAVPMAIKGVFKALPSGWQEFLVKERFLYGQSPIEQAYKDLGLKPKASFEDVKDAWRSEALKWHPDRAPAQDIQTQFEYTHNFLKAQSAYEKIKSATTISQAAKEAAKTRGIGAEEGQPVIPQAEVPGKFTDPNAPDMLNYLEKYVPGKVVAGLEPAERLKIANLPATQLRDYVSKRETEGWAKPKEFTEQEKNTFIEGIRTDLEKTLSEKFGTEIKINVEQKAPEVKAEVAAPVEPVNVEAMWKDQYQTKYDDYSKKIANLSALKGRSKSGDELDLLQRKIDSASVAQVQLKNDFLAKAPDITEAQTFLDTKIQEAEAKEAMAKLEALQTEIDNEIETKGRIPHKKIEELKQLATYYSTKYTPKPEITPEEVATYLTEKMEPEVSVGEEEMPVVTEEGEITTKEEPVRAGQGIDKQIGDIVQHGGRVMILDRQEGEKFILEDPFHEKGKYPIEQTAEQIRDEDFYPTKDYVRSEFKRIQNKVPKDIEQKLRDEKYAEETEDTGEEEVAPKEKRPPLPTKGIENLKTVYVDPKRLATGEWKNDKRIGEGDIGASYSGDTLANDKIRKPFELEGKLYVNTGGYMGESIQGVELVPEDQWTGKKGTYDKPAYPSDFTYKGMVITWRNKKYVLGDSILVKSIALKEKEKISKAEKLSPEQYAETNETKIIKDYQKKFGVKIHSDEFMRMLPGYEGVPTKELQVSAGKLARAYFDKLIEENKDTGKQVVFVGATSQGSGKTTFIRGLKEKDTAAIFELTFRDMAKAEETINKVLENGLEPKYVFIIRKPVQAYIDGVILRAIHEKSPERGRIVTIDDFMSFLEKSIPTLKNLMEHFGDKVEFQILSTKGKTGELQEVGLDNIDEISYNLTDIEKELKDYVRTSEEVPASLKSKFLSGGIQKRAGHEPHPQPETGAGRREAQPKIREEGLHKELSAVDKLQAKLKKVQEQVGALQPAKKVSAGRGVSKPKSTLGLVSQFTAGKKSSGLPIIQGIAFDGKRIYATDLESAIIYEGDVEVGKLVLPTEAVKGINPADIKQVPGKMKSDKVAQIGETTTIGMPLNEYPRIPEVINPEVSFNMPSVKLADIISRALPIASTDEARHVLNGIYLEISPKKIMVTSTDGWRLLHEEIIINLPISKSLNVIVPATSAKKLLNVLSTGGQADLTFKTDAKNNLQIDFGKYKFITRTIEGDYPKYMQVLESAQKNDFYVSVDTQAFLDVVKSIPKNLVPRDSQSVNFDITDKEIVISKDIEGVGSFKKSIPVQRVKEAGMPSQVVLPLKGDDDKFSGINPEYLKQALQASPTTKINFGKLSKPIEKGMNPFSIVYPEGMPRSLGAAARQVPKDELPLTEDITVTDIEGNTKVIHPEPGLSIEQVGDNYQIHDGQNVEVSKAEGERVISKYKIPATTGFEAEAGPEAGESLIPETPSEKQVATLQRMLRKKTRQQLLTEVGNRMSGKSFHPIHFRNFMLKNFQVATPGGLSNRDLRKLIVMMEQRKPELIIPTTRTDVEIARLENEKDKKVLPLHRDFLGRVISNLRTFGEAGNELADSYEYFEMRSAQYAGKAINGTHKIAKMIGGAKNWPAFVDALEGIKPATEVEAAAIKVWNEEVAEPFADRSVKVGLTVRDSTGLERPWHPRENYWPRYYDWNELKKEEFKKKAIESLIKQGYSEVLATEIFDNFRRDLKSVPFGHLEKVRELDVPGYRKDMAVAIEYALRAAKRISWVEHFGRDVNLGFGKGYMPERVVTLTSYIPEPQNREYVYQFIKRLVGRMTSRQRKLARLSQVSRSLQVTKLTFSAIPNFFQHFTNTWPKVGTKAYLTGVFQRFKKEGKQFAELSGAVAPHEAMEMAMMERGGVTGKFAEGWLKACGFSWTEYTNRVVSALAGRAYAEQMATKLLKSDKNAYYKWREQYIKDELNQMFVNPDELKKNGFLTQEQLQDAAFAISKVTQFLAKPGYLPLWTSNWLAQNITQFKNFAYNQTNFIYNEVFKPTYDFVSTGGKKGTLKNFPLMLIAIMIAGQIVYNLKKLIYRKEIYDKDLPLYVRMLYYSASVGGMGIAMDALFAMELGERGIMSFLRGPTLSDIVECIAGITKVKTDIVEEKDPQRATMDAAITASNMTPFIRVVMQATWKEARDLRTLQQLNYLVKNKRERYIDLYSEGKFDQAEEGWASFVDTYNEKYFDATGKFIRKPEIDEIYDSMEKKEKPITERYLKGMPGETFIKKY